MAVLAVVQRIDRQSQSCLDVARHGADPLEFRQITRLETAHHSGRVHAANVDNCCKARQAVANDLGAGYQIGLGPLANGFGGEAAEQVQLEVHLMILCVGRNCCQETHFLLGAAPSRTAGTLAAEVGVIHLNIAAQAIGGILLGHSMVDFVMQQPRAMDSRPARLLARFSALPLGAEATAKFWVGHVLLQLDSLVGHLRAVT